MSRTSWGERTARRGPGRVSGLAVIAPLLPRIGLLDSASLSDTSRDLPPSLSKPSPHARPATPGCPRVLYPSSGPGSCLHLLFPDSAHPLPSLRRVVFTTSLWHSPLGLSANRACGLALGIPGPKNMGPVFPFVDLLRTGCRQPALSPRYVSLGSSHGWAFTFWLAAFGGAQTKLPPPEGLSLGRDRDFTREKAAETK